MSEIIGRGVIEVSADASKMNAAIGEARRSIASLGESSKNASQSSARSIDKYVQSLQTQNATLGKTTRETELYKLALRGASDDQLKAANSALRLTEAYKDGERIGSQLRTGFIALGAAAATGLIAAAVAFDQLVKKAGDFQDIAEKTGDTAEAMASLALSAGTAGVSMDEVASLSIKLSKGLAGVDDETKSAGAAIAALGLNLADFKNLKPADQLEAVGKAMNGFEDSSSKTAIALALFGKSGAEALPFLKELGAEGGRQVILTQEQITLADEYSDKQAKLRTEISLHAQAIASDLLPALNSFTSTIADLAKDQVFAATASDILKAALGGAITIFQTIAIVGSDVAFTFKAVGTEIGAIAAQLVSLATLDFEGFTAISDMVKADGIAARAELDKFQAKIMSIGTESAKLVQKKVEEPEETKKKLKFTGATGKDTADKEANALRDLDLARIKAASEKEIAIYANSEKVMEGIYATGQLSEREYYTAKLAFINLNSKAQEQSLTDELSRLQKLQLTGVEKINNDKKIIETQSKLNKLYADTAGTLGVLGIKMEELNKQGDWTVGMSKAVDEFQKKSADVAGNTRAMFTSAFDGLTSGISSSISQAIVYGKNLEDSLTSVALSIADAFIAAFIKIQIQKLLLDKAASTSYASTLGLQAQAMAQMAALNTFASISAIPVVGPAAAPGAAAAAFSVAEGMAALATTAAYASASARDGYDIPAGVNPITQLHEKEMVLPAQQANVIRDLAKGGGSVGGVSIVDNTVVNIDSRSDRLQVLRDVQRMIESGHSRLIDKLQRKGQLA